MTPFAARTGSEGTLPTIVRGTWARGYRHQADGIFRARDDAKTTGLARRRIGGVCRLAAVNEAYNFFDHGERGEVVIADASNRKYVIGTDFDAIAFCLAIPFIDNGHIRPGIGAALLAGPVRVSGGSTSLFTIEGVGH